MQSAPTHSPTSLNEWLDCLELQRHIAERRSEPRYLVSGGVTISIDATGPQSPAEGWVLDVSHHAIGWIMTEPVAPETLATLDLSSAAQKPLSIRVRITLCHRLFPGVYRIGALFVP